MLTIEELCRHAGETAIAKGWWDNSNSRTFGDLIALIHSEVSEALEEYRKYGDPNHEAVAEEFADILIRIGDLCHHYDIDLGTATHKKLMKNKIRSYRHGGKHL